MSKRKCKFNEELQNAFKMFKPTNNEEEAKCLTCGLIISVGNKGKTALENHVASKNHKDKISQALANQTIDKFMVQKNAVLDEQVAAVELTLAYHTVFHHFSFSSMNCTSKLLSHMFKDSAVASKLSSAKTKTEAIVKGKKIFHKFIEC